MRLKKLGEYVDLFKQQINERRLIGHRQNRPTFRVEEEQPAYSHSVSSA